MNELSRSLCVALLCFSLMIQNSLAQKCVNGKLLGYRCDGKVHTFHSHKNEIANYCGKIDGELETPKLTNGRGATAGTCICAQRSRNPRRPVTSTLLDVQEYFVFLKRKSCPLFSDITGEAPWMASLIFNRVHQCGGVILDNLHILTAAHCVIEKHPNPRLRVSYSTKGRTFQAAC